MRARRATASGPCANPMPARQAPHRGNPSPRVVEVWGTPRFAARAEFIASPCHTVQPEGAAMKYSGLSRGGLAMHTLLPQFRLRRLATLAVLMGVLVAVTP